MEAHTGEILSGPDVISRGFVYVRESEDLMEEIEKVAEKSLEKCKSKEWSVIKNMIKDDLHDFIYSKTKRNPMVIPIITEVNS